MNNCPFCSYLRGLPFVCSYNLLVYIHALGPLGAAGGVVTFPVLQQVQLTKDSKGEALACALPPAHLFCTLSDGLLGTLTNYFTSVFIWSIRSSPFCHWHQRTVIHPADRSGRVYTCRQAGQSIGKREEDNLVPVFSSKLMAGSKWSYSAGFCLDVGRVTYAVLICSKHAVLDRMYTRPGLLSTLLFNHVLSPLVLDIGLCCTL